MRKERWVVTMGTKQFRVMISFDEDKERDIVNQLESLSEKRQIAAALSNIVRAAFDENGKTFGNMNVAALSETRRKFFESIAQKVKEQDKKIDTIYSMCEDLYGLAQANKALGLESKTENLLISQFVLQHQQSKMKKILGEDDFRHLYESDRLLSEKEKAEKIWGFIAEAYEAMIAELRTVTFKEIQIPIQAIAAAPNEAPESREAQQAGKEDYKEEFIDLTERPKGQEPKTEQKKGKTDKEKEYTVKPVDDNLMDGFMKMLEGG